MNLIAKITCKKLSEIKKQEILELMSHPKIQKHMPLLEGTFGDTEYKSFIVAKEEIWKEEGFGPWAFTLDGTFMGWGGLQPVEDDIEVALVLHPNYWGYGRAIYNKIIEEAFCKEGLNSVIILLPPTRIRIKAILNLGFNPDGEYIFSGERYLRYRLSAPSTTRNLKKQFLGDEVGDSYTQLSLLLQDIPHDLLSIKVVDFLDTKVSVSDLVAYQIGWGKLLLHWYESGKRGIVMKMPGEGFSKWDYKGIAEHFFGKYHFDGNKGQRDYFKATVEKILGVIDKEERSGNLNKIGVWQWCTLASGKKWPLSKWVAVNTCAPYKRAYALIRKFLKRGRTNNSRF